MSHRVRALVSQQPTSGLQPIWGVFFLVTLLMAGASSAAEDAGLAFVLGPSSQLAVGAQSVDLPAGARLELLVSGKKLDGRYPVQVRPGGLVLPEIALGSRGERLRVRLADSSGWLTPAADGLAAELTLALEVEVSDAELVQSGAYTLALTTGQVEATSARAGWDAPSGAAIDEGTRSARLVATGTVGDDSPIAPGEPLLVVLDGTFEGLPADLR
jgi:hypothetical protein